MSKATKQGQLDAGGRPASWGQAGAARGVCGVEGSAGGQLGGAGLADSVQGDVVACRRAGAWGEDGGAWLGLDRIVEALQGFCTKVSFSRFIISKLQ